MSILKKVIGKRFLGKQGDYLLFKHPKEEMLAIEQLAFKRKILARKKYFVSVEKAEKVYLVAKEKNVVLGNLHGQFIKFSEGGSAEILGIGVSDKAKGKGVGSSLIKEFLNICRKNKVNCITLYANKKNKKAINFYKKHGFRIREDAYMEQDLDIK